MDINCKKKIQSVKLNLQNGQVEIILRALELYKYTTLKIWLSPLLYSFLFKSEKSTHLKFLINRNNVF